MSITVIQRLNFIMPAIANSDPQIHHNLLARLFEVEFTTIRDIIEIYPCCDRYYMQLQKVSVFTFVIRSKACMAAPCYIRDSWESCIIMDMNTCMSISFWKPERGKVLIYK